MRCDVRASRRRTASAGAALLLGVLVAGCGTDGGMDGEGGPGRASARSESPRSSGSPEPVASSSSAPPLSGMSWSCDRILDGSASLSDLAVVAEDDIWAYGSRRDESAGATTNEQFLLRRDGDGWREQPLPDVLGTAVSDVRLDAVGSGSGEVWLTATDFTLGETRIARWDGTRWSALGRMPSGRVTALKAFAPDDVWALTQYDNRLQHWDGTSWTTVRPPADGLTALDGSGPDDLWAVGYRRTGGDAARGGPELTQPVAVHGDGRTWTRTETPEYHFPDPVPPEPDAVLDHVVVLAEDDVRAFGTHTFNHGEAADEPADEAIHLRWDGTRWTERPEAPGDCAGRTAVLGDGADGVFLSGNWYLTADGACGKVTRSRLPAGDGVRESSRQSLWPAELARLPGTDEVIGVGHVQVNQSGNPMSKAVVVSLDR